MDHTGIHGVTILGTTGDTTTHGTTADFMTHGTMEDTGADTTEVTGDGMTHGTTTTITADGTTRHIITTEVLHTLQEARQEAAQTDITVGVHAPSHMVRNQEDTRLQASRQQYQDQALEPAEAE